ncbi:TPA_exp: putative Polyketide synthase [Trichophyton benhamiae CBS 112371]|uniref:Non-reducing polyketide synthase nscA n=1 Tax=Arthroderma benhamiae (strain ATCC MYA-4681 / CBS 112371) TaxID=663331 RepID=NSCA_ARTBC|nr:polyketide synthase, putative [Trichophyton benhamiae CBS 112371]D4AWH3.1 RecName: Full=Non-reducing polyketide synthase nscA; AltName: Full=Conidial yellow pigment biosynthesis polyketide synthase nscA; AltName: Full=Neosartoricin B biosynthesis protein A [Trichophyton benhamiae CBS 112371]EFE32713.1 polyketide synthase, putative [Trichophyton benhamiae CBS 112371]DAA75798.1 TPA_exp: putative Polyketide synthase [Trichophyton benhamiae CBS 112371]
MDSTFRRVVFFSNEFPSDDLKELFRRLDQHSKDRRFRLLSIFLEESTAILKDEVSKLPRPLKELVPPFGSVLGLVDVDFRQGPLGAAMESSMLTILELGLFIGHYESEDTEWDLVPGESVLAGLSIGILAAAAVALSSGLSDVAKAGAEAVRVSFRLGVYVADISAKLEAPQSDGTLSSWAHVVTEMTEASVQDELKQFNTDTHSPELTKVFISAADKTSVSVSGPPSRIKAAFQHSPVLRYSKSLPLPVYDGLCHASHLYTQSDIDSIINSAESVILPDRSVRLALLSSKTGKPFIAKTASELFLEIGTELLTGTIYLDNVTAGIVRHLQPQSKEMSSWQIDSFRTSLVLRSIHSAVEAKISGEQRQLTRRDLVNWVNKDFGPRRPRSHASSKLAIVGMACRLPGGANDLDLFWKLLEEGRDTLTTVPPDRFDLNTHYDPTGKTENTTQTPYGNFIDRPGFFDAGFFNMSPREAEQTDPMQRLALVTAYEALEMAGVVPGRTPSTHPSRIGTFYGQASDDWRELNASQNISTYAVPGGERAFGNGRINYFFKFSGPSFNLDTACSSGLAAVQAACSALWAGEVDTAIAGGLNVITDPDNYCGLGNAHFLSKTGQCKVWDKDADGYCRADGIGSVVIKRLEDAEADNDNILAVVLGACTNHSAEAISITHPHAGAQKANYRQVLNQAGVNPIDVSYIELHGTGTQAGDAVESESVSDIFAPVTPRRRPDQRLYLGAVKSNIGHGEAAAGIASLLKALLVYQKNLIPMHIGIKSEINPTIPKDLERRNVGLAMQNTPWPRPAGKKRLAVVNSFGAHGGNTTLLLEDAPERVKIQGTEDRITHSVLLSAKSKKSLQANMESLLSYLDQYPETSLADLAYTTSSRRMHHNMRFGTSVSCISGLQKVLRSQLDNPNFASEVRPVPNEVPSVILAFTGQGAYYHGMGRELFAEFPYFRAQVQQLDRLAQRLGFPSVVPVIENSIEDTPSSPILTQLSVVILEIALARFWSLLGVSISAVIGHSLGEYAALAVAGVISATDAIYLVGRRAQLIEERCAQGSHSMLSVRAPEDAIQKMLAAEPETASIAYEVSCCNTNQDTVIGGLNGEINDIRRALEAKSIKCTILDVPYAFHTAQMNPILDDLEALAKAVPFKAPSIPVISPLLATVIYDVKSLNADYLRRATRETVDFAAAIEAAQDMGLVDSKTIWIDVGPHPICAGLVRSMIPSASAMSSCRRNEDSISTISKSLVALYLAGINPCWAEFFKPREGEYSLLHLPKYRWNEIDYWIPYIGTWTLDKAHLKHGTKPTTPFSVSMSRPSALRTSLVHQITAETVEATTAMLHTISDMQHPDFLEAIHGHTMNKCGVATSSIWSDMAFTVGEYLYRRLVPNTKDVHMNLTDVEVLHAQVASKTKGSVQPLVLRAHLNLSTNSMSLSWFNADGETGECAAESFASAMIRFEDPVAWRKEWARLAHLVRGRIEVLEQRASEGKASRLSKPLAYALFKNVVDYADRYRGMDSVVLDELEAMAEVTLVPERYGTWHTPPHWIDSVSHLAGLVMNGSDASNTRDYFFVTPGCDSFRLLKKLEPGARYRSYVRMFPLPEDPNMHGGDVYILQGEEIVGMVGMIRFRRVPRLLMDRFFSPPTTTSVPGPVPPLAGVTMKYHDIAQTAPVRPTPTPPIVLPNPVVSSTMASKAPEPAPLLATSSESSTPKESPIVTPAESERADPVDNNMISQCLRLMARETGLEVEALTADASFVQLGVDSLMSLVLSEKFRTELGVEIKSSLFLECPTIGEMTAWIEEYC